MNQGLITEQPRAEHTHMWAAAGATAATGRLGSGPRGRRTVEKAQRGAEPRRRERARAEPGDTQPRPRCGLLSLPLSKCVLCKRLTYAPWAY